MTMMAGMPEEVAALLRGFPRIGAREQAFAFLTVDTGGFPHAALLSRCELEPGRDPQTLMAAIASRQTRANLRRSGTAGLLAIKGTSCHHLKLRVVASLVGRGILGCVFAVTQHKRDDMGIPLQPTLFRTSAEISVLEDWPRSRAMFDRLAALRSAAREVL
ncbi:hypothetical protein O973_12105 [Mycobacterium avium subsp. avium 11-4751]|nr:hypothetical protein O973_12105 [Mycobacterium avium subsp. avium 11-4751]